MTRELEGGGIDRRLVSGMGAPLNGDARAHKDDSTQLEARWRQQCSGGRGAPNEERQRRSGEQMMFSFSTKPLRG
jgi:hypothetical protein